jgi:hypothetical protein
LWRKRARGRGARLPRRQHPRVPRGSRTRLTREAPAAANACSKRYQIICHPAQEALAKKLQASNPKRFFYHPTEWGKFKDGTDNIEVGGFYPINHIRGQDVIFIASFHNNDVTLSQFHVLDMLCESFTQAQILKSHIYSDLTKKR